MDGIKDGDRVWIDGHWGPYWATFRMAFPNHKKVLVESGSGPEIHDLARCFATRLSCFASAAARSQQEAMNAMIRAGKYSEVVASGKEEE